MRRVRTATVIMMPLAAMLPPAAAQEPKTLEPVVVTATKLEEPQERLGAAVSVITEDDLKVYNYETVGDALRQVPGLEIHRVEKLPARRAAARVGSSDRCPPDHGVGSAPREDTWITAKSGKSYASARSCAST